MRAREGCQCSVLLTAYLALYHYATIQGMLDPGARRSSEKEVATTRFGEWTGFYW
jgi:hypothetical protein